MAVRRRRSADESRSIILEVAARRLAAQGLEGLNITGVAEEAGISHATLIHHFGSSGGMRVALADKMTMDLIGDLLAAFEQDVSTTEMTSNVFRALSEGGHAKLIAWRAVEDNAGGTGPTEELASSFKKLIASMHRVMAERDEQDLQNLVMLVGIAAIGYGLAGGVLAQLIGMDSEAFAAFPGWMTDHIS